MTLTDDEVDAGINAVLPRYDGTDWHICPDDRDLYRAGYAARLAAIPREPTEHMIAEGRAAWARFAKEGVPGTSVSGVWVAMYVAAQGGKP